MRKILIPICVVVATVCGVFAFKKCKKCKDYKCSCCEFDDEEFDCFDFV